MSNLPKFQYNVRDEENELESQQPLLSQKDDPPTYPPQARNFGVPGSCTTYVFNPRWPMKAKQESALGVAGSREYTVQMVKNAFPLLQPYHPDRIEFLAPATPETKINDRENWSKIMDEAWDSFTSAPPARLLVQLADAPGEFEAREKHERWKNIRILALVFSPAILIVLLIFVMAIMSS